ncbi:hypothetical protein LTR28_012491, partial [Elasticomyces elasticus]
MASTGLETPSYAHPVRHHNNTGAAPIPEKITILDEEKAGGPYGYPAAAGLGSDSGSIKEGADNTHRKLKARHIQLIGIGGTIGTALYVSIGRGLLNGGPASLFIAFTWWNAAVVGGYRFAPRKRRKKIRIGRLPTPDGHHAYHHSSQHEESRAQIARAPTPRCGSEMEHAYTEMHERNIQMWYWSARSESNTRSKTQEQRARATPKATPGSNTQSLQEATSKNGILAHPKHHRMAEMVTYLPISSPFIRFAGRYVDDAFAVAAGYNFFVFEAMLVPFEVTACNVILHYWENVVPAWAVIAIVLCLYAAINLFAVKWYGETEFWCALGKVLLIVGLIIFTFIVMLGGNPLHDRFGFRFWKNPGAFAPLYYEGSLGYFLGFLQCLIQASFTIAGPDYVSMAAGEAENPRR